MKILNKLFIIICLMISFTSNADINIYREQHKNLLAKQTIVHKKISFQEQKFKRTIDESEIFCENWDNKQFNPYGEQENINKEIDLRDFVTPIKNSKIKSHFGTYKGSIRFNEGIDFEVNVVDTIFASFDGKVRMCGFNRAKYGFFVIIRHTNGLETLYANLSNRLVKINDYVKAGQPIAICHEHHDDKIFHYEIRYKGKLLNPDKMINFVTCTPLQARMNAKNALYVKQKPQTTRRRK